LHHSSGARPVGHQLGWAVALVTALVASSCASGGSDVFAPQSSVVPVGSPAVTAGPEPGLDTAPGSFIAIVTDAGGSPVPWPEIDGEVGDGEGQVSGASNPSGWYEVSAPGYATTFAKPMVNSGGFDILDVELTLSSSPLVIDGAVQEITMADGALVAVPAGALPVDAWLTVTEIPARHLSAPWAPVDNGNRTRIFSFVATDADGENIQPSQALNLRLDDVASLGGVSGLATFDPDAGRWVASGDCTEAGAAVECAVEHFSLSTAAGGQPYGSPPGPNEGSGDPRADSQARSEDAQQSLDDENERNSEEFPARIKGLLDAAASAAKSNPSRVTKDRLASMIVVANTYDVETAAAVSSLGAAYKAVALSVINPAKSAKKPRCAYRAPLVGVVAEGETIASVGADTSSKQQAVDLLVEIELECRYLWMGTIEYRFPAPERWEIYSVITSGADYEDRGIDQWVETASVLIVVDPDTGQLQGRVTVDPSFVPLRFRIDMNTPDEICPGEFWDDVTVEGVGSSEPRIGSGDVADLIRRAASGAAQIALEFDGSYDEPRFSVSEPRLLGDSGVRIQTRFDIYSVVVPCENISGSSVDDVSVLEPYTTQLVDGFGFLSPVEPKVTLNEMLNSAQRTEPDGRIVIEGRRELSVEMDLMVPFQEGTVRWRFETESVFEGYGGEG